LYEYNITCYKSGAKSRIPRESKKSGGSQVKCEVVLPDTRIQNAVEAIVRAARIKKIGDAKVFVSRIDQVVSIRTAERGESAI
jgi:nitrogen regulatory protein PII